MVKKTEALRKAKGAKKKKKGRGKLELQTISSKAGDIEIEGFSYTLRNSVTKKKTARATHHPIATGKRGGFS